MHTLLTSQISHELGSLSPTQLPNLIAAVLVLHNGRRYCFSGALDAGWWDIGVVIIDRLV